MHNSKDTKPETEDRSSFNNKDTQNNLKAKNIKWKETFSYSASFINLLAETDPNGALSQVLQEKLDEDMTKKLDELSLWRDSQIDPLSDPEKKLQLIWQTLTPYLQSKLQRALKDPSVSQEKKKQLLEARKKI